MPYRPTKRLRDSTARIAQWRAQPNQLLQQSGIALDAVARLELELLGKVVLPSSPEYDNDRQESNPAFQAYPQIIVYCLVPEDVRLCLAFARQHDLWVACRSGGHSTAGYSVNSGMVIDTSGISYVSVDPGQRLARVGAGTSFGHLNSVLNDYNLHIPGGACEDVCVGGYMQAGGYGYTQRLFGLNSDNVLAFRIMLRDGRTVVASNMQNRDLFWAVRGGTGGNFGILLEISYQLHRLDPVWGFAWVWDIADAAALMTELQAGFMRTGASPRLGYMANLATHKGQYVFVLQGLYAGSADEGRACLAPLRCVASPVQEIETVKPYAHMDNWLDNNPYPIPDLPNSGAREAKQAGYIARPLNAGDWQQVVDYYKTTPCQFNTVVLEPYGGAINDCPVDASAFIHRDVDMDFFVDVFWFDQGEKSMEEQKKEAIEWLDRYMEMMKPHFNGHVYQNYPRDTLTDYRFQYFGKAFDALLAIKNKYDPPPYFFHYQQSIKPYPDGQTPCSSSDAIAPPFINQDIIYE